MKKMFSALENSLVLRVVGKILKWLAVAVCLGGLILVSMVLATSPGERTLANIGLGCLFLGVLIVASSELLSEKLYGEDYERRKSYRVMKALGLAVLCLYPVLHILGLLLRGK